MVNHDIPKLHKLQKVLSLTSISEEIDMAIKFRSFFNEEELRKDQHKECLSGYYFKQAYDLLVSHIADEINVED
jgi:hypothetical protein